ncbi:hypothetical protein ABIC65_003355 [Sphingomonas trueperi]|uniref:hypothetical protein n=1 Tax=Sphingomonas trueperi TaxID=53317 RepID=UPI0033976DFE
MTLPAFTNLAAVAEELASSGNVKLRAMVTQAWRAQSCLGDLRQASDCVDVLRDMLKRPTEQDTPVLLTVERSLMANAIMLYARATSTNGDKGERGSIQLSEKKLTPEDWADHSAILDVRNQAVAHVYGSRKLSNHDWHRSIFFAVYSGEGRWKPASASNQTSFHADTFAKLERMLPIALRELKAKFHERMDAVAKVVNVDVKAAALLKHVFDPVAVFGIEEAVRILLADAGQGDTAFWINESRPA